MFATQVKTTSTHKHIQELGDKARRFEVCIRDTRKHVIWKICHLGPELSSIWIPCNEYHYYMAEVVRGPITKIKQQDCSIFSAMLSKHLPSIHLCIVIP